MTVQQAIRLLRDEGLIVSRQGSGVFVRERTARAIALRPHVERAFEQPKVSIDFAGFSGETLHGVLQEPLDKIRVGQLVPESVEIRVLIPDPGQPWAIPCRVADLGDEPAFRDRAEQISRRHTDSITESVAELADLGLVKTASAQVRVHGSVPMFKLYILNRAEAFFGFYPITEHSVALHGESVPMYDLMGRTPPCSTTSKVATPTPSAASTSPRPRPGSTACGPPSAATAPDDRPQPAADHQRHPSPPARLRRPGLLDLRRNTGS